MNEQVNIEVKREKERTKQNAENVALEFVYQNHSQRVY